MGRNQSGETRDADDLQRLMAENVSQARDNLRQSAEIDTLILNVGAAELETARIQSLWEDAQNAVNNWSRAEGPTGVGSGDTTLLIATHTAGTTSSQSPLQNLSVESAVSSSAFFGDSQLTAGGDPMQREAQREFRRAGDALSVLSA